MVLTVSNPRPNTQDLVGLGSAVLVYWKGRKSEGSLISPTILYYCEKARGASHMERESEGLSGHVSEKQEA